MLSRYNSPLIAARSTDEQVEVQKRVTILSSLSPHVTEDELQQYSIDHTVKAL